jgi:hypothetical protein
VDLLLCAKASANAASDTRLTPLSAAVAQGHASAVQALLAAHADPGSIDLESASGHPAISEQLALARAKADAHRAGDT